MRRDLELSRGVHYEKESLLIMSQTSGEQQGGSMGGRKRSSKRTLVWTKKALWSGQKTRKRGNN